MAQTATQDLKSTLAWRFVTAKVISQSTDVVYLNAKLPQQSIKAKLTIDPQTHYRIGQLIPLFIAQASHNKDFWHAADGKMADREQNPWLLGQVRGGDVIEGVVIDYVENYAVIINLTHNLTQGSIWQDLKELTAFLHINETPDSDLSRDIRKLLHIGDTIQAIISKVEPEKLNIEININDWIKIRQYELEQPIQYSPTPKTPLSQLTSIPEIRPEKALLLIDDDKLFCSEMQKLLSHWQIKVRFCHNLQGLIKELSQQHFDACLMDCNLGLNDQEQIAMSQLLEKARLRFARITGDETSMQQEHPQLLLKPLKVPQILAWLDTGDIPTLCSVKHYLSFQNNEQRWQARGAETFVIDRARHLLARCCQKINAQKALWVREERSGYFAIRVGYGIEETLCRTLEKTLQITRIATAIETGETLEVMDIKTGALYDILGSFGYVFIMPFQSDRAVAFFSNKPFGKENKAYLAEQRDHLEDLTYLMDATLVLESNEIFATQGMLLSSTVHEFRTAASIVSGISQRLQELLARPALLVSDAILREDIISMVHASEHLVELSENGLDKIRPEQHAIQNLEQLLEKTLKLVSGRMYTQGIKATLAPLNVTINHTVSLPYPGKYVELPLINLLDNALLHCRARSWARVEVTLSIDTSQPDLPILIQIADSGLGMTAEQRDHLFTARKTGRGITGSGMGLFLSKQLIESIGGRIELEKTVRWLGSCFNIRLPYTN